MIKILINDGIHPDGQTLLEEAGYHLDIEHVPQADLPKVLPGYDVILVRSATKVRKDLIDLCPNLKIIGRGGVGIDNIDADYARSKGIEVITTPAASSQSVAELAFAHMFSLARSLQLANRFMPTKGDQEFKQMKEAYSDGIQLRGKTLGVIGFGRIGQEAARIGIALGMKVMPVDLFIDEADIDISIPDSDNVSLSVKMRTYDMDEVLKQADFITLHVPFGGGTSIIGAPELAKMKTGACLINTSRGGVVDEEAMLEALNSGKLGGAGLDVFDFEPKPRKEILEHPRISMTPHIGASTQEAQSLIGMELADKILAYFGDDK
ncbi:MAG: D-2-hydroxyacid dehydrogenase [Saprospiraceae bacterium]|jgi:D-3-phosphoglycerate dehydrogenase|nr:D-2-hydroxyacid dehydrogenase [Saprospiraceae bacterium]HRD80672.1 D-2-hydroxyacid dehydrogenase [Saprospiraceae bacterium]HRJ13379.1 D-2-hydroxyacid dehydrogenase [Saprospiraceae bacterium]HRK83736.1 D-2-hydroxyacid dehydrogenase [Saprospiraceae bacterium]